MLYYYVNNVLSFYHCCGIPTDTTAVFVLRSVWPLDFASALPTTTHRSGRASHTMGAASQRATKRYCNSNSSRTEIVPKSRSRATTCRRTRLRPETRWDPPQVSAQARWRLCRGAPAGGLSRSGLQAIDLRTNGKRFPLTDNIVLGDRLNDREKIHDKVVMDALLRFSFSFPLSSGTIWKMFFQRRTSNFVVNEHQSWLKYYHI